jgi:peptidoglycan/xylan/chitin deacetylase (PgdA/CDA1 family)
MIDIRDLISGDEDLNNLFINDREYSMKRPEIFKRNKLSEKNIDITDSKISRCLIRKGLKISYPEGKKFAVCLTHDVNYIYPPFLHYLASSLYYLRDLKIPEMMSSLFWKRIYNKSPYINFKAIMRLEKEYDSTSSFFFLSTNEDVKKSRYNIEDLGNELGAILDNNFEVGLHGGYYSFNDVNRIKTEKIRLEKMLGKKVDGYRNHYLRMSIPETWEILAKLGFKYDTTYGFTDASGFRNGLCHPFYPYNNKTKKNIPMLELPLIIMDSALLRSGGTMEGAWDLFKNLLKSVEKSNGVLTLLWHNDVFDSYFKNDSLKIYKRILRYCHRKNAWLTSCARIHD